MRWIVRDGLSNYSQGVTIRAETELKVTVVLAAAMNQTPMSTFLKFLSKKLNTWELLSPLGTGHRLLP
jgi:hypothetical protein